MPPSAAAVAVSGGGADAADELEDRPLEEGGDLEGDEPAAAAAPCRSADSGKLRRRVGSMFVPPRARSARQSTPSASGGAHAPALPWPRAHARARAPSGSRVRAPEPIHSIPCTQDAAAITPTHTPLAATQGRISGARPTSGRSPPRRACCRAPAPAATGRSPPAGRRGAASTGVVRKGRSISRRGGRRVGWRNLRNEGKFSKRNSIFETKGRRVK